MTDLATPDDLRVRLGVTFTDDDLARVEELLADASSTVRVYTGQQFTQTAYTGIKLRVNGATVRLPQRPVQSVQSLVDNNGTTMTYQWRGFDLLDLWSTDLIRFDWEPYRFDIPYVTAAYTAGYSPIPDAIIGVVCQIAGRAFGSVASDAGITQEALGAYSYSRGAVAAAGPFGLMEQEKAILDTYRLVGGNAYVLR